MRVLVTGGTGFIGRHAVDELLARGHEVVGFVHKRPAGEGGERMQTIAADLLDLSPEVLRQVEKTRADALLMLAWETAHGKFWTAPSNASWLAASLRLAQAFLESGGRRIVCAGTCVEYDAPVEGPCIPGETPVVPVHPYAISKDCLHRMLRWMTQAHGATLAWGRIFLAFGPYELPGRLVPSVVNALLDGQTAKCSSGRQLRDFLHAQDYGRAFAMLTESRFDGALNVCGGEPHSIAEVAAMLGELAGRPDLIALGALPDRPGEPQNLWGDASALARETGFRPTFSLAEGLRNTVEWWKEQRQGTGRR